MAPILSIDIDNPAVQSYIVYSAILALKILGVGLLTGLTRKVKSAYANHEDAKYFKGKVKSDETVERMKRAHLNDLENIPAFWIVGALYLTTGPNVIWATLLFRTYTVARVLHFIFYVVIPAQPFRGLSYMAGMVVMIYMTLHIVLQNVTSL